MKHIGALILKFIIVAVILELVLLNLTYLTFGRILVISAAITVIAYLVGDLGILPRSSNTIATIADIGLSFVILLIFGFIYPSGNLTFLVALLASVVLGIGEWVFHRFLGKSVFPAEEHH